MKRTRRFATVLTVGVTALTLSAQTASASLNIPSTYIQNVANGYCVIERSSTNAGVGNSCGWPHTYFRIISTVGDSAGHANVQIQTTNGDSFTDNCLFAVGQGTGPYGALSSDVELMPCNQNDPRALWAVSRGGATINNYTPETFFNYNVHVCLDGGVGLYGYYEDGCNTYTGYQTWNVYTGP